MLTLFATLLVVMLATKLLLRLVLLPVQAAVSLGRAWVSYQQLRGPRKMSQIEYLERLYEL